MAWIGELHASDYQIVRLQSAMRVATVSRLHRIVGLCLVAFVLRTIDLASVPEWHTDEGLWAMPPRDFVLFSNWAPTGYFQHYKSPLFSGVLAAWFQLFGPSIPHARLLDSIFGVVTIAGTALVGTGLGSWPVGLLAAAALAFDGPFIITNRSVLLEGLQTLLIVGCALTAISKCRSRYYLLALLFAGTLLTKVLSIYIAPLLLGYAWYRGGRRGALLECAALAGGALLALGIFGAIALSDPVHFYTTWIVDLTLRGETPALLAAGEEGSLRGSMVYFMSRDPVLVIGLIGAAVWLAGGRVKSATGFMAVWTLVGIVAMSVQGYSPSRYYMPILPVAWLWIVFTLRDIRASRVLGRWRHVLAVGVLSSHMFYVLAAITVYYYVQAHRDPYSSAFTHWANTVVQPNETLLAPLRLVVSTRASGSGWENLPDSPLTPEDARQRGIKYIVSARDTHGRWRDRLSLIEQGGDGIAEVARFGDIQVYRLQPVPGP